LRLERLYIDVTSERVSWNTAAEAMFAQENEIPC
jgi:hypothetical protein